MASVAMPERRVEADGGIGLGDVVVDGLGQEDDVEPGLREPQRVLRGAVAADAQERVQPVPPVGADDRVRPVDQRAVDQHPVRLVAARAEDRAANGQDPGEHARVEVHRVVLGEAAEPVAEPDQAHPVHADRGLAKAADRGVESRAVPTRREDADALHAGHRDEYRPPRVAELRVRGTIRGWMPPGSVRRSPPAGPSCSTVASRRSSRRRVPTSRTRSGPPGSWSTRRSGSRPRTSPSTGPVRGSRPRPATRPRSRDSPPAGSSTMTRRCCCGGRWSSRRSRANARSTKGCRVRCSSPRRSARTARCSPTAPSTEAATGGASRGSPTSIASASPCSPGRAPTCSPSRRSRRSRRRLRWPRSSPITMAPRRGRASAARTAPGSGAARPSRRRWPRSTACPGSSPSASTARPPSTCPSSSRGSGRSRTLPIVAYPNSGEGWDAAARRWTAGGSDPVDAPAALRWLAAGARLVGGCCRVRPEQIAAISAGVAAAVQ